jgi:uncharacterized protein (TIGR02246 family)
MHVRVGVMILGCWMVANQLAVSQEAAMGHPAEATLNAYVEAFNQGNAEAMAACWSEQGVLTSRGVGGEIKGREALQNEFAALLAEYPGLKMEVVLGPAQVISPSVVTQAGQTNLTGPNDSRTGQEFDVVYVQVGDRWMIDRVTEMGQESVESPKSHLEPLNWLLGNWSQEGSDAGMTVNCRWTRNNSFMVRTFASGDGEFSGFQLIGWDAAEERIRSWAFDSNGGFAEGSWRQKGDDLWVIDTKATLPDGALGAATTVFKRLDDDRISFQRSNQVVDGEILPNLDAVVLVKSTDEQE